MAEVVSWVGEGCICAQGESFAIGDAHRQLVPAGGGPGPSGGCRGGALRGGATVFFRLLLFSLGNRKQSHQLMLWQRRDWKFGGTREGMRSPLERGTCRVVTWQLVATACRPGSV